MHAAAAARSEYSWQCVEQDSGRAYLQVQVGVAAGAALVEDHGRKVARPQLLHQGQASPEQVQHLAVAELQQPLLVGLCCKCAQRGHEGKHRGNTVVLSRD